MKPRYIRTPYGITNLHELHNTPMPSANVMQRKGGLIIENHEIAVLDEKESGLVRHLENFGLNGSAARIIVFLAMRADSTIREIGASTGLSTATVSVTLKKLHEQGIVRRDEAAGGSNNRTPIRFCLAGDLDYILSIIEEIKRKEVKQYIKETARVKRQWACHSKAPAS